MNKALKTKSALSYFGSDSEVAAKLAAMLDGCQHVTIPFCGGLQCGGLRILGEDE